MSKMTAELAATIVSHLKYIDKIQYINDGGCGYVALALYQLFTRLGFKPTIYRLGIPGYGSYYEETRNNRLRNIRNANVAAHYIVKVDNYFFDSSGAYLSPKTIRDFKNYNYTSTSIFKSDLVWALKYGTYSWNPLFKNNNHKNIVHTIRRHILSFKMPEVFNEPIMQAS